MATTADVARETFGNANGHCNRNEDIPDQVMMSTVKKQIDHTILRVERLPPTEQTTTNGGGDRHVAGGQHQGIIINKQLATIESSRGPCDLRLSFKVFLVNAITQIQQQELRELRFWFDDIANGSPTKVANGGNEVYVARMQSAQTFFRALVTSGDFPKSYVSFITKMMKTMQQQIYRPLAQIELEVRSIDEPFERPASSAQSSKYSSNHNSRQSETQQLKQPVMKRSESDLTSSRKRVPPPIAPKPRNLSNRGSNYHLTSSRSMSLKGTMDDESTTPQPVPLTEERVLEMIEAAYPNPLALSDIANVTRSSQEDVHNLVVELAQKGVARFAEVAGQQQPMVVRVTSNESQVKRVRQMPQVVRSQQPTVAIITAQFCEKLAVDSMIDNKDTYVRYKVEGESNVYTLGNIGQHRVVATKLPAVGNSRSAMIAAGNTTTRLLGTFQHVEYVFLVGIGGGVPHYTDHRQHVRLGDIVVSTSPRKSLPSSPVNQSRLSTNRPSQSDYVYVHCEQMKSSPPGGVESSPWKENTTVDNFSYRFWCPLSFELQDIAKQLHQEALDNIGKPAAWERYLEEARNKFHQSDDLEFVRPDASTDKLYMSIGPNDMIEMQHPQREGSTDEDEDDPRARGMPKVHFGAIGSGRMAVGNERLRQDIAIKYGIKAFDIEFDTVIESIYGNRKDRYIIIRGIADYKDGARKKEWQPYAALSAAAYMKAILCRLEPI